MDFIMSRMESYLGTIASIRSLHNSWVVLALYPWNRSARMRLTHIVSLAQVHQHFFFFFRFFSSFLRNIVILKNWKCLESCINCNKKFTYHWNLPHELEYLYLDAQTELSLVNWLFLSGLSMKIITRVNSGSLLDNYQFFKATGSVYRLASWLFEFTDVEIFFWK